MQHLPRADGKEDDRCGKHFELQLLEIVLDLKRPRLSERHVVLDHLRACSECLLNLAIVWECGAGILDAQVGQEKLPFIWEKLHQLFTEIIAQTQLPAFLEACEIIGWPSAMQRFPALTHHVNVCPSCLHDVKSAQHSFHDLVAAGIISVEPACENLVTW